jgi:hypothetical protein
LASREWKELEEEYMQAKEAEQEPFVVFHVFSCLFATKQRWQQLLVLSIHQMQVWQQQERKLVERQKGHHPDRGPLEFDCL